MKALVLGGSGFIGSHLVDQLLARNHNVRVMDRSPERFRGPMSAVDFRQASFDDSSSLAEALGGMDTVFHLVSTSVPSTSNLDPIADIEGNLIGTVRLLDLMKQRGVKRLVYLSSGGTVYGIPETSPIPESHRLRPISSYGIVKVAIERYIYMFQRLHGMETVILRPSNPYGPRQGHSGEQGVIGTFLWKIARGEPIEVWGDGSVVRDFIHVGDLARLCVKAGESDISGVFNAGFGTGSSLLDIVDHCRKITGFNLEPVFTDGRRYDVPRSVLDIKLASKTFDWSPQTGLASGIADAWNWVQDQKNV